MRIDALLNFVPIGSPLSLVGGAGVDIFAPTVIDLLGLGVGVVAPSVLGGDPIIGNVTTFGAPDAGGVGGLRPELNLTMGTAAATSNAATVTAQLQAAADNGTGNPSTYFTLSSSGAQAVANLTAGTVWFRTPWLPPFPENLRPRFLRLRFAFPAATNLTAGTIASALVTTVRDDWFNRQAAKNYNVA